MGSPYLPVIRLEVGLSGPTTAADVWHIGDPVRGKIGVAKLGGDDIWVDIAEWVRSWSTRRGAARGDGIGLRYEAGTGSADLNNGDRRFDPTNLTGPYASGGITTLQPMVRVRWTAEWAGVAYPLWTGFADNWIPDYTQPTWSTTALTATDAFKIFNADRSAQSAQGAGEDSGARIGRILTSLSWPAEDRQIAVGRSTMQATTLDGNGLSELLLTQDSELGEFYVDAMGNAVFRNRLAVLSEARSNASQGTFGDAGYFNDVTYGFEVDTAPFVGFGGSIATSAAQAHGGVQSLLLTVTGSPTQAYARPVPGYPVTPGLSYTVDMWVFRPVAGDVTAAIDWIDAGGSYLSGAYAAFTLSANTWTLITVAGIAPVGAATAQFGSSLIGSPAAGTQVYTDDISFGLTVPEIPYASAKVDADDVTLANYVSITRVGGTEQIAQDAASQQKYMVKPYQRDDLIMETDSEALNYAKAVLGQSKDPEVRFSTLVINVPRPEAASVAWPQLLGRELGDRITIIRRPPGGGDPNSRDCWIRGIEHTSDGETWQTTFQLETVDRANFWTIGHPTLGRIGSNALAF